MITQDILAGQSHRANAKRLHKRTRPNLVLASYGDGKPAASRPFYRGHAMTHLRLVTVQRPVRARRKRVAYSRILQTVLGAVIMACLFSLTAFTIGHMFTALLP